MSKLEDYYRLFDMFRGKLTDAQKEVLGGLEDQIIAEEILPAISKSVAPVLSNLRRNLTLVVDYDTQRGITVKTTRGEVVVKEDTAKKYEIPSTTKVIKVAEVEKKKTESVKEDVPKIKRSPRTGLCVYLADGSFIQEANAALTMAAAIESADAEKVFNLQLPHDGDLLVSRTKHPDYAYAQKSAGKGYLVNTHSSTATKKKQLERISNALNLGWRVEIIK